MSGRTKIKLPWQTKFSKDVSLESVSLTDLVMPEDKTVPEATSPNDVINRQYVEGVVGSAGAAVIGPSEDGTYDDGLFQDFEETTEIGTAVDRFNELFKALAPAPAPSLSNIGIVDSGISGKLSFGTSNVITGYTAVPTKDVGGSFTSSGEEAGIFAAGVVINGDIADNVAAGGDNNRPYPAKSFGDADQGSLHLEVNGIIIQTVDLTAFSSGASINSNGSGFNLSAAAPIQFDSGETLDLFKYRTGTWTVNAADQVNGYNVVKVRHEYATGLFRDTNIYGWVIDDDTTATTFANEDVANPSMSGINQISGITYHTAGTIDYSVTISNPYRNTYSASASAVNYTGTNISPVDEALSTPSTEIQDVAIVAQTMAISSANRMLNGSVSIGVSLDRTVQSDLSSPGDFLAGFLVDATVDSSTDIAEPFNGEGYRLHTGIDLTNINYGSGKDSSDYDWDSSQNLMSGGVDYTTGLLISNGQLSYPSQTNHITDIAGGDFSSITYGPGGNPNYATASGDRTYLRYFYSPLSHSNFRLALTTTNTSFVTVATSPSLNNVTLEVLAPNTTKDTGGTVEFKDAVEPHNANDRDIGCFASTFGDTIPSSWGLTLGAENTSTSGQVIVVRITASSAWAGSIDSMNITWL